MTNFKNIYDSTKASNECDATRDKQLITMQQMLSQTKQLTVTGIHFFDGKDGTTFCKVGIKELPDNFIFAPKVLLNFFAKCVEAMGGEEAVCKQLTEEVCTFNVSEQKTKDGKKTYYKFDMIE